MSHRGNRFRIQLACACLAFSGMRAYGQEAEHVPAPPDAVQLDQAHALRPTFDFQPKWVWSKTSTDSQVLIEQLFYLDSLPSEAELQIAVDNEYSSLKLNSKELGTGSDWTKPKSLPILASLQTGFNKVTLVAKNNEGDAGAIVVIRLKYGPKILVVGTSDLTTVLVQNADLQLATTRPATAAPWNLVKPESERFTYVRAEAKRFLEQIHSSDEHVASRSLGILAQFAIDFTSLELNGPTVSLGSPSVKPLTLSAEVYNQVVAQVCGPYKIKQQAACAAVTLLTAKTATLAPLFDVLKPVYCNPEQTSVDLQLAILSGIDQRLDADGIAYSKRIDDYNKDKVAMQAAADEAKSKMAAKKEEVEDVRTQLSKTLESQVKNTLQIELLDTEINELTSRINDPNNAAIKDQLVKSQLEKKALKKVLENKNTPLASQAATQQAKLIQLEEEHAGLSDAYSELAKDLGALAAPAPSAEMLARLTAIEQFLQAAVQCNSPNCVDQYGQQIVMRKPGIVGSLERQLIEDARALRYRYMSISTIDQAEKFFALTTPTVGLPNPDIGAATSAADRPTAANGFTSADRASVSNTAPYDPTIRPQSPPQYPLSDYRGQRLQRDISKDEQNVVRKAPGAKPAEAAK